MTKYIYTKKAEQEAKRLGLEEKKPERLRSSQVSCWKAGRLPRLGRKKDM